MVRWTISSAERPGGKRGAGRASLAPARVGTSLFNSLRSQEKLSQLGRAAGSLFSAAKRPLPPSLFHGLGRLVAGRGVGNVVIQRPYRCGWRAGRVLFIRGCGVDFVGHGAKSVTLIGKTGLVMLHTFALRLVCTIASATAATAAAAAAAWFAIFAQGLSLTILLAILQAIALRREGLALGIFGRFLIRGFSGAGGSLWRLGLNP